MTFGNWPDQPTVLIYDISFTVSEPNYYLKDIYYFWHVFKQLMFKPLKILKRIFPHFYFELCHSVSTPNVILSYVQVK